MHATSSVDARSSISDGVRSPRTLALVTAALAVGAIASGAAAEFPEFEDVPFFSGGVGSEFTSFGAAGKIVCFESAGGTEICSGVASVNYGGLPCNVGWRLNLNNCAVAFDFEDSIGVQTDLRMRFGEFGGNINVGINGEFTNVANWIELDDKEVGGVLIRVESGGLGNDCGIVRFVGEVGSLLLGGQEFWVDGAFRATEPGGGGKGGGGTVEICGSEPLGYEDLVAGTVYGNLQRFESAGVTIDTVPLLAPDGTFILGGFVEVDDNGLACGSGLDLKLSNSGVIHRVRCSPGTVRDLAWRIGYYGGIVAVGVNGQAISRSNILLLHGAQVGGCTIYVLPDLDGSPCGFIRIVGEIEQVTIGGQELWIDCADGELVDPVGIPGDIDGDGDVDGADNAVLLGAWGPCGICEADLNCDGFVNGADLAILLANWT